MAVLKTFHWQGIDERGLRVQGDYCAERVNDVNTALRQQRITPLRVRSKWFSLSATREHITAVDITQLCHELATLLTAGISLVAALDVVRASSSKASMQHLLHTLLQQVTSGQLLSQALRMQPRYFDAVTCQLVYVAEQSGALAMVLTHIALQREKMAQLRQKVRKATFYPTVVLCIASLVMVGLLMFVVPEFQKLFASVGAELPAFTRLVITAATTLKHYGVVALGLAGLMGVGVRVIGKRSQWLRERWDRMALAVPWLRVVLKQAILARCFRMQALTLTAGLTLLETLELSATLAGNSVFARGFSAVAGQIAAGQQLHVALKNSQLFPARVLQLVAVGEESGCLDSMLTKLADYYEQQLDQCVQRLSQSLEPAVMLVLAVLVGALVIAMYLPIFRLAAVV